MEGGKKGHGFAIPEKGRKKTVFFFEKQLLPRTQGKKGEGSGKGRKKGRSDHQEKKAHGRIH